MDLLDKKFYVFFVIFSLILFSVTVYSIWSNEELLKNGKRLESVVVDMDHKEATSDYIISGGAVIDMSNREEYSIKVYVNKKLYDLSVSDDFYNAVEIGKKVKVIEYKDKVVLDN